MWLGCVPVPEGTRAEADPDGDGRNGAIATAMTAMQAREFLSICKEVNQLCIDALQPPATPAAVPPAGTSAPAAAQATKRTVKRPPLGNTTLDAPATMRGRL